MTSTLRLTAVVGGVGKTGCAHLARQVLSQQPESKIGLITSRHSFVCHECLPPPDRRQWRSSLSDILGSMARRGCTHGVLTLPVERIRSGEAEGLPLETAIVTGLDDGSEVALARSFLKENARQIVCNLDDAGSRSLAQSWRGVCLTYAEKRTEADLAGRNLRLLPNGTEFEALTRRELLRVTLPVSGGYELYQALGALGCGMLSGVPLAQGAAALKCVEGIPGRMELLSGRDGQRVLIDSASTPEALENLLFTARGMTAGELLLIIGASPERSKSFRRELGAVCCMADRIYLTADDPGTAPVSRLCREIRSGMGSRRAVIIPDRRRAIHSALCYAGRNDLVVLAGRGDRTTMRVGAGEVPFDERQLLHLYHIR